jgi:5-methylcytosine-specific restriction enzyme B
MRRRFSFVELHPEVAPTNTVLRRWLAANDMDPEPADLLDALNQRIHDRAARIGPSYLMPRNRDLSETALRDVWAHELLPLLEEHHYGENRDIDAEFGIDALRRSIAGGASA